MLNFRGDFLLTFSKKRIYINGNWLIENENCMFKSKDGENMFTVYLNLQRFIRHNQLTYDDELIYITSIQQLYKAINYHSRTMDVSEVYLALKGLERLNIIDIVSHRNFHRRTKNNLPLKELLIIKDLDYMSLEHFIVTPLDVIDYILNNDLSYRHIALFLLMVKWTNNTEEKCYVSINKLADWLGFSNNTVLKYCKDLNRVGVMASYKLINESGHYYYNHYLLKDMDVYEEFNEVHRQAIKKMTNK